MSLNDKISRKPWLGWTLFLISVVVVFFIGLLASSIIDRRAEAAVMITPKVAHSEYEPRNEVWGENYPRQYDSYLRTRDTSFSSKHMGAAMVDMLEEDPRMVVLWAGYGFSKDYNQGRGHYYAIEDIHKTLRTGAPIDGKNSPMPNTCWTCKSPDVPRLMAEMGAAEFYKGSWDTKGHEVVNHIGCADCHDAKSMNLRISRPALVEAFERQGKNIEDATHQEMRSLVCAQCHVEYYFNKDKVEGVPYLTFPWDKGMSVEKMEEYYDNMNFVDWTHSISKAPMLKAQHPDYEMYLTGIHAQRGVSCADCHMPYKSEGGEKFTDHHMQSPLNNVEASCAVCHREKTEQLISDVYSRQDKINESRYQLEKLIVRAHVEAKVAWDNGATEEQMKDILQGIRHAQWRWDYVAASHGGSFHSPVESGRVLSSGIVIAQETRIKLVRLLNELGVTDEIPYPPIDTKADAQIYIGLDVEKLEAEKQEFMKTVVPEWLKKAAEREKTYELTNL
jgi:nitrite reductase (cytochrome c-552)